MAASRSGLQSPLYRFLRHEQQRGEENEKWNHAIEQRRRGKAQQPRAGNAAGYAGHNQREQARSSGSEFPPVSPDAPHGSWPDRYCAGGIRRDGIQAKPNQSRERDERSASGDRIDHTGKKRGAKGSGSREEIQ